VRTVLELLRLHKLQVKRSQSSFGANLYSVFGLCDLC
jgi:hypothetical protein